MDLIFYSKKISFCENAFYYYNILPDHLRYIQLDTLYISHTYYQFTKFNNDINTENIQLASIYWGKAHEFLKNIFQGSIMENIYLLEIEKEYDYDAIKHPSFDSEMQYKYMLEKINEH